MKHLVGHFYNEKMISKVIRQAKHVEQIQALVKRRHGYHLVWWMDKAK